MDEYSAEELNQELNVMIVFLVEEDLADLDMAGRWKSHRQFCQTDNLNDLTYFPCPTDN